MGGRGSSAKKSSGGSAPTEKSTNARFIENMNESQIRAELAATEDRISKQEDIMRKNNASSVDRDVKEAFPLGVGAAKSRSQIRKEGRDVARKVALAKKYTKAYDEKKSLLNRKRSLESALKKVKGTGKTSKQLLNESKTKASNAAKSSGRKWKTTQKSEYKNGAYRPKIIKSGEFEIRGSSGRFSIYMNGKNVGVTNKLKDAKGYVETLSKRRKK